VVKGLSLTYSTEKSLCVIGSVEGEVEVRKDMRSKSEGSGGGDWSFSWASTSSRVRIY
jgi:hypothetical protein